MFSDAWFQSMTMKNIVHGFKSTVYRVARYAIKLSSERRQMTFRPESLAKESGLAYIPLYSTSHQIQVFAILLHLMMILDLLPLSGPSLKTTSASVM